MRESEEQLKTKETDDDLDLDKVREALREKLRSAVADEDQMKAFLSNSESNEYKIVDLDEEKEETEKAKAAKIDSRSIIDRKKPS